MGLGQASRYEGDARHATAQSCVLEYAQTRKKSHDANRGYMIQIENMVKFVALRYWQKQHTVDVDTTVNRSLVKESVWPKVYTTRFFNSFGVAVDKRSRYS